MRIFAVLALAAVSSFASFAAAEPAPEQAQFQTIQAGAADEGWMRPRINALLEDDTHLATFLCGTAYLWSSRQYTGQEAETRTDLGARLLARAFTAFHNQFGGEGGYPGQEPANAWLLQHSQLYWQVMTRENRQGAVLARCDGQFR